MARTEPSQAIPSRAKGSLVNCCGHPATARDGTASLQSTHPCCAVLLFFCVTTYWAVIYRSYLSLHSSSLPLPFPLPLCLFLHSHSFFPGQGPHIAHCCQQDGGQRLQNGVLWEEAGDGAGQGHHHGGGLGDGGGALALPGAGLIGAVGPSGSLQGWRSGRWS